MSESKTVDLLLSTVAVVMDPASQASPINVPNDLVTGILREPINVSVDPIGQLTVTSTRDQIELQLLNNKIDVREVSGDREQGIAKIPRIVHELMALLENPRLRTYGINFVVELPQDDARTWLSSKLLSPVIRDRLEGQLSSNQVNLVLDRSPEVLTVLLTSRGANKINVNFNASVNFDASEESAELPSIEGLGQEMVKQYQTLIELLGQLEG